MFHTARVTHIIACIAGCAISNLGFGAANAQGGAAVQATEPRAILELFTSQGCSSCPPADALFETYAKRKDVIALSLPVDYWDYLGWKDTLANPKFSARQKSYAKYRGDGRVYTPQVVVNGVAHVVGNNSKLIDGAIAAGEAHLNSARVPVRLSLNGGKLVIETGPAPPGATAKEATVWLVMLRRKTTIKIEKGENHGKSITYHNVVREMNPIGVWSGVAARHEIQRDALAERDNETCVVLLQVGKAGPIIGAAKLEGL